MVCASSGRLALSAVLCCLRGGGSTGTVPLVKRLLLSLTWEWEAHAFTTATQQHSNTHVHARPHVAATGSMSTGGGGDDGGCGGGGDGGGISSTAAVGTSGTYSTNLTWYRTVLQSYSYLTHRTSPRAYLWRVCSSY